MRAKRVSISGKVKIASAEVRAEAAAIREDDPRLDDGQLYPSGHPVQLARLARAIRRNRAEGPGEVEHRDVLPIDRIPKRYAYDPQTGRNWGARSEIKSYLRERNARKDCRSEHITVE